MRKFLLSIAALLIAGAASAQPIGVKVVRDNTNNRILVKADDGTWLTVYGSGAPSFTTFLGDNVPSGAVYVNTANGGNYSFSSGSWTLGSATAVITAATTTITGTCTSKILSTDASKVIQCTSDLPGQVNISGPDSATNVEIGSTTNDANAGTGGTATVIGNNANNSGNGAGNTILGSATVGSTSGTNNVLIGAGASITGTASDSVVVGRSGTTAGTTNTQLGTSTSSGTGSNNVIIGNAATVTGTGGTNVVIGNGAAGVGGANGVAIGSVASTGGFTCVAIGVGSTCTAANQFVSGIPAAATTDVYFNKGVTSTAATAFTLHGTGGSGNDNAGGGVIIDPGLGTGSSVGGDLKLGRSPSIATGSTAQTRSDALYVRSQMKALTAATATPFARINLAQGVAGITGWTGGTVFYTLVANDAAEYQSRSGTINFTLVNKGGTETCAVGSVTNEPVANSSGTTTLTFDTDTTGPTNGCDLRATGASSLSETTLALFYTIILNGPGTVTPQ